MNLQISVFLLFVLFTAGHSLSCYTCSGSCAYQTETTCPREQSKCMSVKIETQYGSTSSKSMAKGCIADCATGSMSHSTAKLSSVCCSSDKCNAQVAPDPPKVPNGKTCYSCDGASCWNKVSCSGSEDRCFKGTVTVGSLTADVKGCMSKSLCSRPNLIPSVSDVLCCEGNLCNGAQSVTHSFLFLCSSLLTLILLH